MTTFRTHPDQAVVLFDAELTWAAATDLVDVVDLMVHGYFYRRIEIVIASNGGLTLALDHYLAAPAALARRWGAGDHPCHLTRPERCGDDAFTVRRAYCRAIRSASVSPGTELHLRAAHRVGNGCAP